MTKRLVPDRNAFLPFAPGELDRSGLRLTRAEFARFLGCSKQAVSEWVTSGKITLGTDGRLDPRQAVSQLLRNSDPAKLRAKVLAPLVRDVGELQRRIGELEAALAGAKENAEFNEEAAGELIAQQACLLRHLREERGALAQLPGQEVVDAIEAWLQRIAEDGIFDPEAPLLGGPIDGDLLVMDAEADRLLGFSDGLPGAPEKEEGGRGTS